ncbi:MAG: dihydroorotate dehydrogenase electron transfer subunit [Deltaproteobacteria bacterium]|nr:dihydroorotate dehydrogenase electron transfer subunit [Deltaproteobacteria bacterium]MBI3076107.1 dihydroorotate dehydrogenase electron transfer subunit [Deltaproteobacteria bacterium]
MYEVCTIVENRLENPRTNTLFFDRTFSARPGQFFMVWLPGAGERPFSLAYPNGLTSKVAGEFTAALMELKPGEKLWLRGPYGRGFPLKDGFLFIGGGVGIAGLRLLADRVGRPRFLLGGKDAGEILYHEELARLGEVRVATEDGSLGMRGLVTDLLPAGGEHVAICGPERMMAACLSRLTQRPSKIYLSIERYMKCGIGLCGNCSCSGRLVCTDGPVFTASELRRMPDFGRRRRGKTGAWTDI